VAAPRRAGGAGWKGLFRRAAPHSGVSAPTLRHALRSISRRAVVPADPPSAIRRRAART
jgi:hypothetical protein